MDKKILNRRKKLLNGNNGKTEKEWEERLRNIGKADTLSGNSGIHSYFNTAKKGIKPVSGTDKRNFFGQSLEIFRAVYELQKQHPDNLGLPGLVQLHESYDVLITLVGFSLQPLIHTILTICPTRVYPLVTNETRRFDGNIPIESYFEHLISQCGEGKSIAIMEPVIVNTIGSIDAFQKIRQIIQDAGKDKKVAIDITGGKKSMDVSAFLAAAIEKDIHIFYVDFEGYDKDKVQCGTEFLNKLDNPYDIYNVDLMNKGKELFDNHNYQAACDIFTEIENKLNEKIRIFELGDLSGEIRKLRQSAEAYKWWDRFEYNKAYGRLASTESGIGLILNSLKKVDEIRRSVESNLDTYFQTCTNGRSIDRLKETYHKFSGCHDERERQNCISDFYKEIGRPSDFKPAKTRKIFDKFGNTRRINCETLETLMPMAERKWFICFAFDLFCNAKRRKRQGRFEDATVRLTRILEIYAQYMFIKQGNNPFRKDNGDPVSLQPSEIYGQIFNDSQKTKRLGELADIRNNLSIIHSIGRGSSEEIIELEEQAKAFLKELWAELNDDLKRQINMTADITEFNFHKNAFSFRTVAEICQS
ncbi:DUF6293 family protein [Desulfobacterales bacterium HSG2]|nr:DUF6293 family protein [Desulfobacterales bacterium HSG2]